MEIEWVPSAGGVFEVTVDDRVVFNKHLTHRFPNPGEVTALLKA